MIKESIGFTSVALVACAVACSGSTSTPGDNGSAGSAGSVTSGGSAGKAGTGGSAGSGGSAGGAGSGGAAGTTGSAGSLGASGAGAGGSVGSGGSGGSSGCDCVSSEISWGRDGGFVAYSDSSTVTPCRTYRHTREPRGSGGMPISCTLELFGCGVDALGVGDLTAAVSHPDMVLALDRAPILYGRDTRPVDGQVFQIRVGGKLVEIGTDCTPSAPSCAAVPAGVRSAMLLLQRLDTQELGRSPCREQFPQP